MLCPNCKEIISDHLLICPLCKETISEPVTFQKRSVQINKEAVQIYDELTQEEKKEHDYLQSYKRSMYKQAKSLNLNNDKKEDVLDILGKEAPVKPNLFLEVVLTLIASLAILALAASSELGFVIPFGVTSVQIIYVGLTTSVVALIITMIKLIKRKKALLLVCLAILHLAYIGGLIYLHWIAKTL